MAYRNEPTISSLGLTRKVATFVGPSTDPPNAEGVGDIWYVHKTGQPDELLYVSRWDGTNWVAMHATELYGPDTQVSVLGRSVSIVGNQGVDVTGRLSLSSQIRFVGQFSSGIEWPSTTFIRDMDWVGTLSVDVNAAGQVWVPHKLGRIPNVAIALANRGNRNLFADDRRTTGVYFGVRNDAGNPPAAGDTFGLDALFITN